MGTVVLSMAFVFEAAFAAYCIGTRSSQRIVSGYIRIGAFTLFAIFTLASVILWSFRWYGLAALLLVWAALGTQTCLHRPDTEKDYKAWRSVWKAAAGFLLISLVMIPALIFPQHKLPKVTGTHAVSTANYTYADKNRTETFTQNPKDRQVNVEFWYPRDAQGDYPLLVFSPGAFGMKTSNTSTFVELASNGYVVCSIDHPYHALYTKDSGGHVVLVDQAFLQEVVDVNNGKYDEATAFKLEQKWLQLQTADINFVVDTIIAHTLDAHAGEVYQLIDPQKIGLIGHSLGGEASAQLARARNDIDAVVDLDADLGGEYLQFVDGRYVLNEKMFPAPFLVIFADDLVRLMAAVPKADTVIAVKHVIATAPNAYEVHITGTDHQSLTDLPITSPFMVSLITTSVKKAGGGESADKLYVIEKMNAIVLQFFNAYLKGEGGFSAAGTY